MNEIKSLRFDGITKEFDRNIAVNHVSFEMTEGKVYSIVGENGAGKSTVVKMMNGTYEPTSGRIFVNNEEVHFSSPSDAAKHGIGIVYQELRLIPNLSVAENIFISQLTNSKLGIIHWKNVEQRTREYLDLFDLKIDPKEMVGNLKVAYQQIIAIIRAYAMQSRLVILDEPTSALPAKDIGMVLDVVKKLIDLKCIVVYISHKLDEVLEISDEIIAMRNGEKIGEYHASEMTKNRLVELIAGRSIENKFPKRYFEKGEEILRFEHVSVPGYLKDISFTLHKGEILGFTGLLGAGKTEIAKTVFGIFGTNYTGDIYFHGKKLKATDPKDIVRHHIGLVPEDRGTEGLILDHSIQNNTLAACLGKYSRCGVVNEKESSQKVMEMIGQLSVKCSSILSKVRNLSGGNQQKVVLSKWIAADSDLIIFDEPTRGIDVGAKTDIYNLMNDLVEQGIGIMIMSSEADEVIGICDRIVVLQNGEIKDTVISTEITEEQLLAIC